MSIPLITPEEVKSGSLRQVREQGNRVRDLSEEEDRLVKRVNDMRELERTEKKRISAELEVDQATLATRKTVLAREVDMLESRKEQALKPAREIEEQAKNILATVIERETAVSQKENDVKQDKEKAIERLEELSDLKQLQDERDEKLDNREIGIGAAEAELKRSAESLGNKWADYHSKASELVSRETNVTERESFVESGIQANLEYKQQLEAKEKTFADRERGITDGYATLESARKEIIEGKLQ